MSKFIDETGNVFGRWKVLGRSDNRGKRGDRTFWICECECGNIDEIEASNLRSGHSQSCGCYHIDKISSHKCWNHKFFETWRGMIGRCYNEKHASYKNYGARGITVCEEWKHDPAAFCKWCDGQEPIIENYTLDRIDTEGNYFPKNCRFASKKQQVIGRRTTVWIEHNGEKLCFKDFCKKYGLVRYVLANSRVQNGWEPKRAALTPLLKKI